MDIIENVEESGVFLDYTGKSLPWWGILIKTTELLGSAV
jgi:hypothetical protein